MGPDFGTTDSRLFDLIDRWETGRRAGKDLAAEVLCVDCPELVPALELRIQSLRTLGRLLSETDPQDGLLPETSNHSFGVEFQATQHTSDSLVRDGRIGDAGLAAANIDIAPQAREAVLLDNGRYELLEQIGEGGMGAVFRARHVKLNRDVALKMIHPRRNGDRRLADRFRREIQVCARLQHEHIVHAFDVGEHQGLTFLVLEYIHGSDLASLVRRDGWMSVPEAAAVCLQAASGLAYAHAMGIVHRDVKPLNILLSTSGVTKILDMGLARIVDEVSSDATALTRDGDVAGSVDYMSPEQGRELHSIDARSDVYSLGATLYFLLAGRPPYPGGSTMDKLTRLATEQPWPLAQIRPDVPEGLIDVVQKMMAKSPDARFASMLDVVRALKPFAADQIAGRPVVTASVHSAAQTRYSTSASETSAMVPLTTGESDSVLSQFRRSRTKGISNRAWLIWSSVAVLAVLAVLAGVGLWISNRRSAATSKDGDPPKAPIAKAGPAKAPLAFRVDPPSHFGGVTCMTWSPDYRLIASGGGEGNVLIRDPVAKSIEFQYTGHHSAVYGVVWSRDGERIASCERLGDIHVWETATGKLLTRLKRPPSYRHHFWRQRDVGQANFGQPGMDFSPDGNELAYGDGGRVVRWNIRENRRVWGDVGPGYLVRYSPTGKYLVASRLVDLNPEWWTLPGATTVWETTGGKRLFDIKQPGWPCFLQDDTLALINSDAVQIRDPNSGKLTREYPLFEKLQPRPEVLLLEIPRGNRPLRVWTKAGIVQLDLSTGRREFWKLSMPEFAGGGLAGAGSTPGLDRVAVPDGSTIRVRELRTGAESRPSHVERWGFGRWTLFDGRYLQFGRWRVDHSWNLDLTRGQMVELPFWPIILKDGRVRAIAGDRVIEWPNLKSLKGPFRTLSTLEGAKALLDAVHMTIGRIGWSPDGNHVYLLTGQKLNRQKLDREFLAWDALTGKVCRRWKHDGPNNSVRWLATKDLAIVWQLQGQRAQRIDGNTQAILGEIRFQEAFHDVALSPNGKLIAFGIHPYQIPQQIAVYDAQAGKPVAEFRTGINRNFEQPNPPRFSPSSRYMTYDGEIWDPRAGNRVWNCPEPDRTFGTLEHDYPGFGGSSMLPDDTHIVVRRGHEFQVWNWRQNKKRATVSLLPEGEWVFVNHETGHWNGSPLAYTQLRCFYRSPKGDEHWMSSVAYERETGWKNDPAKAGLKLQAVGQ